MIIQKASKLEGTVTVPGDKTITQEALILASISDGRSILYNYLDCKDTRTTINALRSLGIAFSTQFLRSEDGSGAICVYGTGLKGLQHPGKPILCANSGTTLKLLMGLLCSAGIQATLTGDDTLKNRPMNDIVKPLQKMGATITSLGEEGCPPFMIGNTPLKGKQHVNTTSSAPVKSALLLASLNCTGKNLIYEMRPTRNHIENLLEHFGAEVNAIHTDDPNGRNFCDTVSVEPINTLHARDLHIPGDFSIAANYIAAALLVPGSIVRIPGVNLNPTRTGFLRAVMAMGATIHLENKHYIDGEIIGDLTVVHSALHGIHVQEKYIPSMIDEISLLAIVATQASGKTTISGLSELRNQKSNRLLLTYQNLYNMGAKVEMTKDSLIIEGPTPLYGAPIITAGDARLAMAFSIAGLIASPGLSDPGFDNGGLTDIDDPGSIGVLHPHFYEELDKLLQ